MNKCTTLSIILKVLLAVFFEMPIFTNDSAVLGLCYRGGKVCGRLMTRSPALLILLVLLALLGTEPSCTVNAFQKKISVVGSVNADTFLRVQRIPVEGENLTCLGEPTVDLAGGKGCTQAIAASKLIHHQHSNEKMGVAFACRLGDDAVADSLRQALVDAHVDLSATQTAPGMASGRGYVFLTVSGQVSAVVSGGSNQYGWKDWEESWNMYQKDPSAQVPVDEEIDQILDDSCQCLMLQREVPEFVNQLLAAKARNGKKN